MAACELADMVAKGLGGVAEVANVSKGWGGAGLVRPSRYGRGGSAPMIAVRPVKLGLRSQCGALDLRSSHQCRAVLEERRLIGMTFAQPAQEYFPEDENMDFWQRLVRAWQILFPRRRKMTSNAAVAKQRLKMILISDRCSVSDEAKRRIVTNIVGALSDFVEIESEDKVQLNVTTDPDLGTVYSVTVPVRRVKPEYQEYSREMKDFEGIQYDDGNVFGEMRTLDIRFENAEASETEEE